MSDLVHSFVLAAELLLALDPTLVEIVALSLEVASIALLLGAAVGFQLGALVALVRFPGWAEMVGALGLILPAATRIKPFLTPLAAAGLATVMLLATGFHLFRGEAGDSVRTLVLLALTVLVAYGRWKKAPIEPR